MEERILVSANSRWLRDRCPFVNLTSGSRIKKATLLYEKNPDEPEDVLKVDGTYAHSVHSAEECLLVKRLPDGPEWVYELKLDGYRAQAIRELKGVRLLSRNRKDLSKRFPGVASSLTQALLPNAVMDGELVAMDEDNCPSFQALQNNPARNSRHVLRRRHPDGPWAGGSRASAP
jgi:ATP-dependent DNA ligase